MAPDSKNVAPPAYELLGSSEAASQIFFDRIQATVTAECGNTDTEPFETKRMRNFLLYCLAVDYRWPCPLALSPSDRAHFLDLWNVLAPMGRIHKNRHLRADERNTLAPYFWKYLHTPCARLGIPVESAVLIVARHAKYLNAGGRYKGCVHGLLHSRGPAVLAGKLFLNRSVLAHRLTTSNQMRLELTHKITEAARPYFFSIDGLNSTIFHVGSEPTAAFTEEAGCRYELTARGQHYQNNRQHTMNMAQRTIQPLLDKARACISSVLDRHEVFPRSKSERLLLCDHTCMGPGRH